MLSVGYLIYYLGYCKCSLSLVCLANCVLHRVSVYLYFWQIK